MSKVSVTYNAPEGDDYVVTMRGVRFYADRAEDLDDEEHADLIAKLRNNQHFEVSGEPKQEKPKQEKPADVGLKAVHNGGPRFVIKRDGEIIKDGLNKADAEAFNALSEEDKATYVEE